MPSYSSFVCINCETYFHVIWPEPLPSHLDPCSKIKIECPECHEVNELYAFLLDTILQAPVPNLQGVRPLSISPRDPNPDPDARSNHMRDIWTRREQRYRGMYRLVTTGTKK
jgi:hypothetical protein